MSMVAIAFEPLEVQLQARVRAPLRSRLQVNAALYRDGVSCDVECDTSSLLRSVQAYSHATAQLSEKPVLSEKPQSSGKREPPMKRSRVPRTRSRSMRQSSAPLPHRIPG